MVSAHIIIAIITAIEFRFQIWPNSNFLLLFTVEINTVPSTSENQNTKIPLALIVGDVAAMV